MKPTKTISILLITILLSACASLSPATPASATVDINALQTSVVQTVIANITQTAAAQPTQAPSDTPIPVAAATAVPTQPAVTPTAAPSATTIGLCDNSIFVSDASVADGTHMGPGQAFVKTWRVKNTGSCTWSTNYHISYGFGQDKMGGLPSALPVAVLPGQETEISVNLTAPQKPGNYFANWRLTNDKGFFFGQGLTLMIVVP